MISLKKIALILFALQAFAAALTPEDFGGRLDNFVSIRDAFFMGAVAPGQPQRSLSISDVQPLVGEMKAIYGDAYAAKASGDKAVMEEKALELDLKFALFQEQFPPQVSLGPLKELALSEFITPSTPTIPVIRYDLPVKESKPTIAPTAIPTPSKGFIPTVSPNQMRGRKNFVYALGDIIWENKLMLGVFLAGMLLIYALYSKQEEQADLEYSGD